MSLAIVMLYHCSTDLQYIVLILKQVIEAMCWQCKRCNPALQLICIMLIECYVNEILYSCNIIDMPDGAAPPPKVSKVLLLGISGHFL